MKPPRLANSGAPSPARFQKTRRPQPSSRPGEAARRALRRRTPNLAPTRRQGNTATSRSNQTRGMIRYPKARTSLSSCAGAVPDTRVRDRSIHAGRKSENLSIVYLAAEIPNPCKRLNQCMGNCACCQTTKNCRRSFRQQDCRHSPLDPAVTSTLRPLDRDQRTP